MSSADAERAAVALSAIWARHRPGIMLGVGVIDAAVAGGLAGRLDDAVRARARGHAHRLAGSSGTFGFAAAGDVARELERSLTGSFPPSPNQCEHLADLVAALRRELGDPAP